MEKTAWPQHARSPHLAAQRWRRSQRIWTWASGGALALAASAWCRSSSHPQLCGNGGYMWLLPWARYSIYTDTRRKCSKKIYENLLWSGKHVDPHTISINIIFTYIYCTYIINSITIITSVPKDPESRYLVQTTIRLGWEVPPRINGSSRLLFERCGIWQGKRHPSIVHQQIDPTQLLRDEIPQVFNRLRVRNV